MKCIMNPRPDIQEELIKPYKEMEDVYSALEDMARAEINLYQTKDKK